MGNRRQSQQEVKLLRGLVLLETQLRFFRESEPVFVFRTGNIRDS